MTEQVDTLELERASGRPAPLSPAVHYMLWALVAIGVLLRLRLYFLNPALWLDEATLFSDLLGKTSLTEQMQAGHTQMCPLGFLLLMRAAVRAFGTSEYALRLVPLLCGLAAFVPFYFLARRCLGAVGLVVALCLFAVSPRAIRYAAVMKPYSMDLAVCGALAWLCVVTFSRQVSVKWAALLAAVGAVAVWFSYPAAFMLAGFGTALGVSALLRKDWRRALRLSAVGLVWMVSFGAYYVITIKAGTERPDMQSYWQGSFMPLPPASRADLRWFPANAAKALKDPGGFPAAAMAVLALAVGLVSLARRGWDRALGLVAPIGFVLFASGLRLYPFATRLLLFSLPLMYVPIAAGAEEVWVSTRGKRNLVGLLFVTALLGPIIVRSASSFNSRSEREEIRPVLAYVAQERREGDVLYLYYGAAPAFEYYAPRYGLGHLAFITGINARTDPPKYRDDLRQLRGRGRVWVIMSHFRTGEWEVIPGYLDEMGARLSEVKADGAAAYLYDMKPAPGAALKGP